MQFAIENGPGNAVVTVSLDAGERVEADLDRMIARSTSVKSDTQRAAKGEGG